MGEGSGGSPGRIFIGLGDLAGGHEKPMKALKKSSAWGDRFSDFWILP
jgi:hypothetical protein